MPVSERLDVSSSAHFTDVVDIFGRESFEPRQLAFPVGRVS